MGSDRRARRQRRAQEFGARHPRLTLAVTCAAMAGVAAVCGYQFIDNTYLGLGWVIAGVAGMATAAGLSAAVLIRYRRHGAATGRVVMAWQVLAIVSTIGILINQGPHSSGQAFFNVVHAAGLGYDAVTLAVVVALLAYLIPRSRPRTRGQAGHAPGRAGIPARLRFTGVKAPTWRAGHLIAANGMVTWVSWNGDTRLDLTTACHALPILPPDAYGRQAWKTTLVTDYGLAEVDVSPMVLVALVRSLHSPPYDGTAQD